MGNYIVFKKRVRHSGRPENPVAGTFYWMNDGSFWFSPVDGECRRLDTDEDVINGLKALIDEKVGSSEFESYKEEVQSILDVIGDLTANSDFEGLREEIVSRMAAMDDSIEDLETSIENVNSRIDNLKSQVENIDTGASNERVDEIESRLDELKERLDNFDPGASDERIVDIESKLIELEEKIDNFEPDASDARVDDIIAELEEIVEKVGKIDDIESRLGEVESRPDYKDKFENIECDIENLSDKLDELEAKVAEGDSDTRVDDLMDSVSILTGVTEELAERMDLLEEISSSDFDIKGLQEIKNDIDTLENRVDEKQDELVSGTNIKTINGESILGDGDIQIESTPKLKWRRL